MVEPRYVLVNRERMLYARSGSKAWTVSLVLAMRFMTYHEAAIRRLERTRPDEWEVLKVNYHTRSGMVTL